MGLVRWGQVLGKDGMDSDWEVTDFSNRRKGAVKIGAVNQRYLSPTYG